MGSRGSEFGSNGVPKNLKAEDLYFVLYQKDGKRKAKDSSYVFNQDEFNVWELEAEDILTVGYDENGMAYAVDSNGNPTQLLKEDPEKTLKQIGEGMTLSEAQGDFETKAENALNEYNGDPWNFIDDNPDNHIKIKW